MRIHLKGFTFSNEVFNVGIGVSSWEYRLASIWLNSSTLSATNFILSKLIIDLSSLKNFVFPSDIRVRSRKYTPTNGIHLTCLAKLLYVLYPFNGEYNFFNFSSLDCKLSGIFLKNQHN